MGANGRGSNSRFRLWLAAFSPCRPVVHRSKITLPAPVTRSRRPIERARAQWLANIGGCSPGRPFVPQLLLIDKVERRHGSKRRIDRVYRPATPVEGVWGAIGIGTT
jgi:hypothetical protein